MFSIGVITYSIISGRFPFSGKDKLDRYNNISNKVINFKYPKFPKVSEQCKEFIMALLEVDPDKRLTSNLALKHPWI